VEERSTGSCGREINRAVDVECNHYTHYTRLRVQLRSCVILLSAGPTYMSPAEAQRRRRRRRRRRFY
jgi:hypothetical protein